MLYPYVFVAGVNKHEYLRRFIGVAGIPIPVPTSMPFDAGDDRVHVNRRD